MLNANKCLIGKQMLTILKLTALAPVPADYERTLADIVKVFPEPAKVSHTTSAKAE
jgi:hypothetical protein